MAKSSGGTRNYSGNKSTYEKRKKEYDSLMNSKEYSSGYFSSSGGYYVVHKEHNKIMTKNGDHSDKAARILADKGYKVVLQSEKSTTQKKKVNDGVVYSRNIDFKSISTTGQSTIKSALEKASAQGADTVVLYQNTDKMTRGYVENQISLFIEKSPARARAKIKEVIVVGERGSVHRHKI